MSDEDKDLIKRLNVLFDDHNERYSVTCVEAVHAIERLREEVGRLTAVIECQGEAEKND